LKRHTVRESRLAKKEIGLDVDTPVGKHHLDILPADCVFFLEATTLLNEHGELKESNLFGFQPARRQSGCVDKEEEACDTENNGNHALEKEDPSPTLKTCNAVHLSNASSEKTGEGTRQCTGAVEV
jgi:hypothetical protein